MSEAVVTTEKRSLADLEKQIAALTAEAEALRIENYANAVREVQATIDQYGIPAADLTFKAVVSPVAKPRAAGSGKGVKAPIKYRDANGNTWSGRGLKPRWLRDAIESGQTLESFLIDGV